MSEIICFVGAGDFGNKVAIELSEIYEGLRDGLFYEEHDEPQNHLHIHSFPFAETPCFDGDYVFIILAGSVHDPCWKEARNTVHEKRPSFMLTIGIDHEQAIGHDAFQPFLDECLVLPDPSLFEPVELSQLVLQIFLIHTPWTVSGRGSLIGYDPADTMQIFARKATKVRKMTSDKEQYRQNFSKFLGENKADLSRTQGMLMSFWGRDDVLTIPKVNGLWEEMKRLATPDANRMFTLHILPKGEPAFMATLFLTL
ncbi:MAG: hypothetical protein KKB74_07420 [Bacteroidetes bacterium]|nr:hypothetical protein [Bacteroidota bacterium]